jgi:DNA-binding MarR family transcriptional regulator
MERRTNAGARFRCDRSPADRPRLLATIYVHILLFRSPLSMTTRSASFACACSRIRRAGRAITQLYDDALAPSQLRATQFGLLRALAKRGPLRITELAAELLLDRTALSRNLDPLCERGLVEVSAGADARTRRIVLTAAGKRALATAEPHWLAAQQAVAQRIGAERIATLYALLEEVEALHPASSPAARER